MTAKKIIDSVLKVSDVKYNDFFGNSDFSNDDFIDYDHLNQKGAEKLMAALSSEGLKENK